MIRISNCTLVAFILVASISAWGAKSCTSRAALDDYERANFIEARYGVLPTVAVQLLASPVCNDSMLKQLHDLRATVRFNDAKVGYALVMIKRERVLDILDMTGVDAVSASYAYYPYAFSDPTLAGGPPTKTAPVPPIKIPYPRVAATQPDDGPYFAAAEAGLTAFWARHPEADGRGVRIALVDQGTDLLHPAVQLAKDADGNDVPKIVDIDNETRVGEDSNWVQFGEPFETQGGQFSAAERTWKAPTDGTYRFGIFSSQIVLGFEGNPLAQKIRLAVGVLWDEKRDTVWVDTDGDGDFGNERALGEYSKTHDIAWFGKKDGDDDNRIPFGINLDRDRKAAYIGVAKGGHGGMTIGPLSANRRTGGLYDGAAPNSQVVDTVAAHIAFLVPYLTAFARPDVDIVNRSGGIGNAGRKDFQGLVAARAVQIYDKPLICVCTIPGALSVMDYQSPEMLLRNRRAQPPLLDSMNSSVWWMENGLVNTILAPSASLVTESRYMPTGLPGPNGMEKLTPEIQNPPAPAGYTVGSNPSPTVPVVSGVIADLITEARKEHVRYSGARLIAAVSTGTHLIDGFAAAEQGLGLVNADGAWNQLVRMAKADDPTNPTLTSFTVAKSQGRSSDAIYGFHGSYDSAGAKRGELWIIRHGGYHSGRKYEFSLRGNDGTFSLVDHAATLLPNVPAKVSFRISVQPGLHVALLQLRDVKADVVMLEIPLTAGSPATMQTVAPGVDQYETKLKPRRVQALRIEPTQAQATLYDMRIPYIGPPFISFRYMQGNRWGSNGGRIGAVAAPDSPSVDEGHHVGPMEEIQSLVLDRDVPPLSGTFGNIIWDNRSKPEYETSLDPPPPDVPIPAQLTVTSYSVKIERVGSSQVRFTNLMADVEGVSEFYDAKLAVSELNGQGAHSVTESLRDLPTGIAQWRIRLKPSSQENLIDLFVLDCTQANGKCRVVKQQAWTAKSSTLTIDDPKAGQWKVIARARNTTASPRKYTLQESFLSPREYVAKPQKHAHASSWTEEIGPRRMDARYAGFRLTEQVPTDSSKMKATVVVVPLDGAP